MKTHSLVLMTSLTLLIACAEQTAQDNAPAAVEPETTSVIKPPAPARLEQADAVLNQPEGVTREAKQAPSRLAMSRPALADAVLARPYYPPLATVQDRENYQPRQDNPVKRVQEEPVSTFSIDVDTAAYSNVRRMLSREGRLPPGDAVKAEEMINYFSYNYALPDQSQPFSVNTAIAPAPWNADRHILQVGLRGYEPAREQRPHANLVFLVDVSGSMQSADKLGLVKQSLRLLVNKMTAEDTIAIAVYAGAAGMVLEPTAGDRKATILAAIDGLSAGGSTNGGAGIQLAYALAEQHFIEGGINRVIIASDGDMNVGTVNIEALKDLVKQKRQTGIALTTLGFGAGNYNDALMEQLADVGNGNAAYIDSLREANKVLVQQMQATLLTIAKDVKIQIEFNPALVAEYRLIGYQNRLLNREDFTNDNIDAGDIGAGHTVTALYELTLVGAQSTRIPALRYAKAGAVKPARQDELAFVKLRYKQPRGERSRELSHVVSRRDIVADINQAGSDWRFASAVAGFSQLLRGGHHTGSWSYAQLLELAGGAKGEDRHGYRGEFIGLVELAQSLAGQ